MIPDWPSSLFIHPELYDNFPRILTFIAEWVACMIYIIPRSKRISGFRLYGAYFGFAVLLMVTNYLNEHADGVLWVLLMAACMLEMYLMIWLCCKASAWKAMYHWAHAFMAAEFSASLEWQINCYIIYEVRHLRYAEFFYAMGAATSNTSMMVIAGGVASVVGFATAGFIAG